MQEVPLKSFVILVPALALIGAAVPTDVAAQQRGTRAQQADNARQTADLRARFDLTDDRVASGERRKAITPARAAELHRQITRTRQRMTALSRRQGFVSAAELASYSRMLDVVDRELDRHGVERSYGNDALPSAEMIAFQRVDARLHYRDARFEYDADNCALYQGRARDGRIRRERLLSPEGQPFCTRR